MISSVSSVNFRGDKDLNALINEPGKFSNTAGAAQPQTAPAEDKVDLSTKGEAKEKKHTGAIIGGIVAGLFLLWAGLGLAVGKGKMESWKLAEGAEGWGAKLKDYVYKFGESAKKSYDATLGKWFGKKAAEATEEGSKIVDDAANASS